MMMSDVAWPDRIWLAIPTAVLIGMAKPTLDTRSRGVPLAAAVMMPTTCPDPFTSGPPESPGLMGALDWIRLLSCSTLPLSSRTVIVRFSAVIDPLVTVGVPPFPRAFPMATTLCPGDREDESPRLTVGSPDAPWIWSKATSSVGSAPTTMAL